MSLPRPVACLALAVGALVVPAAVIPGCAAESDVARPDGGGTMAPAREGMTPVIDAMLAGGRFKGELWRMNLSERFRSPITIDRRTVTVDGDKLLAQDQNGQIHAIDRASGAHRWLISVPGPATQTVGGTDSTLTFVATDEIVAVARASGARRNGTAALPRPYSHLQFFPSGRAVTVGSTAYVGRLAPFGLQSVDLAGSLEGWAYSTTSAVVDVVAFGDGPTAQVIGVTEDGLLFSLPPRAANESSWAPQENWHRRLAGTRVVTPLALQGDSLVFGSDNGFLWHVDARTGTVRWKVGCGRDMRGHEALLAGGAAYQRTDDVVQAFDLATGAEQWTAKGARRVITRIGERVYADFGADVAVLDAKSGKELARFAAHGLQMAAIRGGGPLIATDGTNVFALE